jgi:hypothetical protein
MSNMKRHMTQMEITKTRRLIENGVVDIATIQTVVFCHEDCIRNVLEQYDVEIPEPAQPPKLKAPAKKVTKVGKPQGAAAAAAAKLDPIS